MVITTVVGIVDVCWTVIVLLAEVGDDSVGVALATMLELKML